MLLWTNNWGGGGRHTTHKTHSQFLDLASKGWMKSHMLEQGGPETYTEARLLTLTVFLQKE